MIDLKAEYGRDYRITLDESASIPEQEREEKLWYYRIPGRLSHSHIGVWNENTLSVYAEGPLVKKIAAYPGLKVVQRGDREIQATFPPEMLNEIASLIKAKKRKKLSPEQRERLISLSLPHRFQSSR